MRKKTRLDNFIYVINSLPAGVKAKGEEEASEEAGTEARGEAPKPLGHLAGGGYTGGGSFRGRSILWEHVLYMYLQARMFQF